MKLCESLSNITGIDMECLRGGVKLVSLSTARKMSWAKGRATTRPEVRAHSLMGIFDGFSPTEETSRVSSDLAIFAWDTSAETNTGLDAFASKPDAFVAYRDISVPTKANTSRERAKVSKCKQSCGNYPVKAEKNG